MKRIQIFFILLLVAGFANAQCNISNMNTSAAWSLINAPTYGVAQQIIAPCSGDLISINLTNWASANSLQIRTGNNPNAGTIIYDAPVANGSPVLGVYALLTPVALTSGQSYVIRIVGSYHSPSTLSANSQYAPGTMWYSTNSGSSWINYNNADLRFQVIIGIPTPTVITWDGSSGTDWNTAANWSTNAVPTSTSNVVIPNVANDPVISGAATVNNMDFASGATLSVASGGTFTLNGTLTNAGAVTIQSGGSFLQGNSSSITGAGTFSIQRQGGSFYNFWSSPITAQSGVPGTSYSYNSAVSTQDDSDDNPQDPGWSSFNGTMTPGKGYAGLGGGLATFTGAPNNGNVNYSLFFSAFDNGYTQTSGGTPFNLVGNPYPSAISASSFLAANTDLHGTIYLWNDNGSNNYSRSDYAYWNGTGGLGSGGGPTPNGFIGTAQGFMVRALNGGAVANFTNAQRVAASNGQFHKVNAEDSRIWFSVEGENQFNEVLIGQLEDATIEEDRLFDAVKLKGNPDISFSAISNETEYAILAFPPSTEEHTVPLKLSLSQAGTYTFKANTMEGFEGYQVSFVDVQNELNIPLVEGEGIDIALGAGDYMNRFYLNFSVSSVTSIQDENANGLYAWINGDNLMIQFDDARESAVVEVYDVNGRVIMQREQAFAQGTSVIPLARLATGVYVVRATVGQTVSTQKVIKQ